MQRLSVLLGICLALAFAGTEGARAQMGGMPPPSAIVTLPNVVTMGLVRKHQTQEACADQKDDEACKRLEKAEAEVEAASKRVKPPSTQTNLDPGTAAAQQCGGISRERGDNSFAECESWRAAVEARAKAAAAIEARATGDVLDAKAQSVRPSGATVSRPTTLPSAAAKPPTQAPPAAATPRATPPPPAPTAQPTAPAQMPAPAQTPAPATEAPAKLPADVASAPAPPSILPAVPATRGASPLALFQVGPAEQVAFVGQPLRVAGVVGHNAEVPRVRVNGQPVTLFDPPGAEKSMAKHSYGFRIDVPTDKAATHIYVIEACDSTTCFGKDMVVRVVAQDGPATKGRNYALIIGNNAYRTLPRLKTAANDARELAAVLKSRYRFDDDAVKLVIDADRTTILSEFARLRAALGPDDRLLVYYAGHGQIDQGTGEGFWQAVDAQPNADFSWISNGDLRRYLRGMSARHVLVVSDSCFAGALTRSGGAPVQPAVAGKDRYFAEIDSRFSRKVITSGGNEPVADSGTGEHSVFAYYFLKALRENKAPYLTSSDLFNNLARAVTNNSSQKPEHGTIGQAGDEGGGDFTFILKN